MLILADDRSMAAMTPAAERWLEEIQDWPRRNELPQTIPALAGRLRAQA